MYPAMSRRRAEGNCKDAIIDLGLWRLTSWWQRSSIVVIWCKTSNWHDPASDSGLGSPKNCVTRARSNRVSVCFVFSMVRPPTAVLEASHMVLQMVTPMAIRQSTLKVVTVEVAMAATMEVMVAMVVAMVAMIDPNQRLHTIPKQKQPLKHGAAREVSLRRICPTRTCCSRVPTRESISTSMTTSRSTSRVMVYLLPFPPSPRPICTSF